MSYPCLRLERLAQFLPHSPAQILVAVCDHGSPAQILVVVCDLGSPVQIWVAVCDHGCPALFIILCSNGIACVIVAQLCILSKYNFLYPPLLSFPGIKAVETVLLSFPICCAQCTSATILWEPCSSYTRGRWRFNYLSYWNIHADHH